MGMTVAEIYLNPFFLAFMIAQFVCYVALIRLFSGTHLLSKKPLDAAYRFIAFGTFCWFGLFGGYTWFFDARFHEVCAGDKIFCFYEPARLVCHVMLAFMIFDTFHLFYAGGEPALYIHHILTLVLGNIGLMYSGDGGEWYMLYYGVFFFGFAELSSVPLLIMGIFRQNPDLAKECPALNQTARVSFLVAFLSIRIAMWNWVVYDWVFAFFPTIGVAPLWAWGPFAVTSILITLMQWYWGFLLVKGAIAAGKDRNKSSEVVDDRPSRSPYSKVVSEELLPAEDPKADPESSRGKDAYPRCCH